MKRLLFVTLVLLAACTPIHRQAENMQSKYLLITNVNVVNFDTSVPDIFNSTSVLIRDQTIEAVGTAENLEIPKRTRVVDGKGHTLLPGLVDMHVHLWDEAELGAYLARGITTVRNASGMPFHLDLAQQVDAGLLIGPKIITTGPILNGNGPNTQVNHQIVQNAEEARQAVRDQYAAGYRHLKVYSNLSKENYTAIREEARLLDMTLKGHSPEGVREAGIPADLPFNISFEEIIDDNFVSLEHMETIVWHALYDEFDQDKARQLATRLAAANVSVDPTLIAFRNLLRVAQSEGNYLKRPGTEMLNPFVSETETDNFQFWSEQSVDRLKPYDEFYLKALNIFHQEGVTLVTGTDAGIFTNIPGVSLIEELKLFVEAGLTPFDALQAATINAAKTLQADHVVGKIRPGYRADLVLVRNGVLENLDLLMHPVAVVKRGVWYDKEQLDKFLDNAQQTDYERTMNNVLKGLEAQGSSL